jgi:hypothetical protein
MTDLMPGRSFVFSPVARFNQQRSSRIMTSIAEHSSIRTAADNPNHHLWNNHGTWFLHYTVHPTPFTKDRIRRSLGTKDLELARSRRDTFFAHIAGKQAATYTQRQ